MCSAPISHNIKSTLCFDVTSSSHRKHLKLWCFTRIYTTNKSYHHTYFIFSCGFMAVGVKWFDVHLSHLSWWHREDTNVDTNHPRGDCCLMCVTVENKPVLYMWKSERHQSPCSRTCSELRAELPCQTSDRKPTGRKVSPVVTSEGSRRTHIIHRSPSFKSLELMSTNAQVLLICVCCSAFEQTPCLSFCSHCLCFLVRFQTIT